MKFVENAFERFASKTPICVMARATLENALSAARALLALAVLTSLFAFPSDRARADSPETTTSAPADQDVPAAPDVAASQAPAQLELAKVNLNLVDHKLALSLAVEQALRSGAAVPV